MPAWVATEYFDPQTMEVEGGGEGLQAAMSMSESQKVVMSMSESQPQQQPC